MLLERDDAVTMSDADRNRQISGLFASHYDSLMRLAFLLLADAAAAEETVMEVFAKSLAGWPLFKRVEWPPAYLRRMVVNECRTRMRRKSIEQRANALMHRDESHAMHWPTDVREDHLDLWRAVQRLPHRQRLCVVLRYVEDLPERDIAEVLEIPVGTVKSQLSRARDKLAGVLGDGPPRGAER